MKSLWTGRDIITKKFFYSCLKVFTLIILDISYNRCQVITDFSKWKRFAQYGWKFFYTTSLIQLGLLPINCRNYPRNWPYTHRVSHIPSFLDLKCGSLVNDFTLLRESGSLMLSNRYWNVEGPLHYLDNCRWRFEE